MTEIVPVLQEIYLLRLALQLRKQGESVGNYNKCCILDQVKVSIDVSKLLRHSVRGGQEEIQKAAQVIEDHRENLAGDPKKQIHGHDFVTLLIWYIRSHRGFGSVRPEDISIGLYHASANLQALDAEPLFAELLRRLRRERDSE